MDDSEPHWGPEFSSPKWGPEVVEAIHHLLGNENRAYDLLCVTLIGVHLERDADGVAFLRAIYDDSRHDRRIGLRRKLDNRGPLAHQPGMTLAESFAFDIAHLDMAEPLGTYWDRLTEDETGVWWWGDGYPGDWP